ncbi:hypothetical protein QQS21_005718 [Conoideocrella luteorostrata]|uniref:Uncharacterized protein n=1 Tax=Conoideocrella luteorostrata TaxID=1105319 RepID=A0AAJ0CRF7_9HYPO|nr:hypothetical protein QQS21_005718 [Conoideocrella luteorostrata]
MSRWSSFCRVVVPYGLALQAIAGIGFHLDYSAEIDFLIGLGPRLTGSPAHNVLIEHIEKALTDMGLETKSDNYKFEYMTEPSAPPSLFVDGKHIEIASVYPYSGLTNVSGVTSKLIEIGPAMDWHLAEGSIAVLPLSNPPVSYSTVLRTWDPSKMWKGEVRNPLLSTNNLGQSLAAAKEAGVKAVILAWDKTISPSNAQNQYLPCRFLFAGLPAAFVSGRDSKDILAAAQANQSATFTLASQLRSGTSSRTLYAAVKGKNATKSHESVLIITHTDGTNVIEENGHIGMLQLVQDTVRKQPHRTHVFVFTTGHLRIPSFSQSVAATSRWLDDHPELWAGGPGQHRAVAGLAIEHLGPVEFVDDIKSQSYTSTGKAQPEILYASTRELAALTDREWRGADPAFVRVLNPSNLTQFGEGAALSDKGIPNVSLATGPLYLFATWEGDEHDLLDMKSFTRQVESFRRLRGRLDVMDSTSIICDQRYEER